MTIFDFYCVFWAMGAWNRSQTCYTTAWQCELQRKKKKKKKKKTLCRSIRHASNWRPEQSGTTVDCAWHMVQLRPQQPLHLRRHFELHPPQCPGCAWCMRARMSLCVAWLVRFCLIFGCLACCEWENGMELE